MKSSKQCITAPLEQLVITSINGLGERPLFVTESDKELEAPPELSTAILKSPSLQLERLHAIPRKRNSGLIMLWNSAFSPSDKEVTDNARVALLGELEHIKLYRIILSEYTIHFEFYNSRTGLLSSLQPNFDSYIDFGRTTLQPLRDPFKFMVRHNSATYYICHKWSRSEQRRVTTVKIRDDGKLFCHRQPLHMRWPDDCEEGDL